ncbi:hypothetical protein HYH03_000285 [Edaphochlamys debaryana]|uniref:Uncharacterized protein n=1 Tax=Edaphochlamys debaryana TaxID=47281 RepID=A0A835YNN5_9CHLO|nr:hypothetical protein HYH03_000285 [Edaphochlamys debaryana]|eukprot:KAG2501785.1 hypothetical protein HYH03_000285 [Edaphochlamys debaryana]
MQFIEQSGETADRDLQANACAVLSGLMAVSDDIQERVLSAGVVSRARALLAEVASGEQRTLQLNALACLAEALRDREAQAEALVQEGGLEPVLSLCRPDLPARLQEAAADVVCALACAEASRGPLSEQGAVTKLAGLLATENHDVRVRALMGLGMLLPQRGPNQVALAGDAAAVGLLLGLMRQTEDLDCRSIARDLFAGLASNPECKDLIAAAMRA